MTDPEAPRSWRVRVQALAPAARAALTGATLLVATASANAGPPAAALDPSVVSMDLLASGLPALAGLAHAKDSRLFLTTLDGRILTWRDGSIGELPFLDLRALVSTGGERGLLGLAFHPRHADNGLLFVAYTDAASSLVIARYRVGEDPDRVDPESGVSLLEIRGNLSAHFSGQLQFGPDGYLYASVGSGPWVGDAQCNGQRLDTPRGKLLRLDVDTGADAAPYHTVPPTNPFAGGRSPAIWAYGLRNPWRFSFDRVNGDLFIADVGEHHREEIDRQPAASPGGENYGWARMEGSFCADLVVPCNQPVPPCGDPSFSPPILEHDHADGFCAVIGGYVYRGAEIPELEGRYLYGDFCSGRLYAASEEPSGWSTTELGVGLTHVSAFGEDAAGEIYLATTNGTLARLSKWPGHAVPGVCVPEKTSLCLDGGRVRAAARWLDHKGASGLAGAVQMTADSGYFWFFDPSNVELVVKLLDGCEAGLPSRWLFAAGLTDLEVDLRLLDLATGTQRAYHHPGGAPFPSIQDLHTFECE